MRALTWTHVFRRRLERHHLVEPAPATRLLEVVGSVCGIHAQIAASAELSIGARVARIGRGAVQDELWEQRRLIRTYGIRGTVHLFPTHELPMWLAALRANPQPNAPAVLRTLGIEQAQMDAMVAAIGDALDGRRLTRQELGDEVAGRLGAWAKEEVFPAFASLQPRWTPAIGAAATAGLLCFGPNRGNRVTFVRPDQWAGDLARGWTEIDGRAALAEVLRRYLSAYGPATTREFAQWFAMKPGDAAELARPLVGELEEVEVEGERRLMLMEDVAEPAPSARGTVRLLPSFDCYVVGSHPRDRLIPPQWVHHARDHRSSRMWATAERAQLAGPIPVLLVDGVVAGMWSRRRMGRGVELRVTPFGRLTAFRRRLLVAEAERIQRFLAADVSLSIE